MGGVLHSRCDCDAHLGLSVYSRQETNSRQTTTSRSGNIRRIDRSALAVTHPLLTTTYCEPYSSGASLNFSTRESRYFASMEPGRAARKECTSASARSTRRNQFSFTSRTPGTDGKAFCCFSASWFISSRSIWMALALTCEASTGCCAADCLHPRDFGWETGGRIRAFVVARKGAENDQRMITLENRNDPAINPLDTFPLVVGLIALLMVSIAPLIMPVTSQLERDVHRPPQLSIR